MSKNLDYIIDEFYKFNNAELKNRFEGDSAKTEYVLDLSKTMLKERIYSEIKEEVKADAIKEAKTDIQNEKNITIRKIAVEGFTISFLVGLTVNQMTELLQSLKELDNVHHVIWTFIATAIFIIPAILLLFNSILSQITEVMSKGTDKNAKD